MGVVAAAALVATSAAPQASPADGDGADRPALYPLAVPGKPRTTHATFDRPAVTRIRRGPVAAQRAAVGALTGKTIYVSAGHGWNFTSDAWRTQRGNTHDIVEDFITAEGVNQFLIPMLHAMGAYVVPIREPDLNPHIVVVDEPDATIEGAITTSAGEAGWGPLPAPFTGSENPFALGTSRTMAAAATETGRAIYAASVPASGFYNVYVSHVQGPDRVSDAHVIVRHAGGESHVRIDQRRHGGTWMLLGRWYFDAGAPVARSSIAVANDSAATGGVVSLDAVRLGGGMASHVRGGATTGRAAFESAAKFSTQLLGAPPSVWQFTTDEASNDVVSRPRFAAWEHEAGEDAVYLAWHTNAPSPSRGTMSIAYGNTYPCCSSLADFAGTPGSLELLHAVHDELLADLRAGWDSTWRDAGKVTASLGELRPTHNGEMPAILVELAFHDTALDAAALREPRFQKLAARAMAQGVARYFAKRDGAAVVLPPEPPTAVRVENLGDGALRVSWRPPVNDPAGGDAPTGYRVYVGDHGYGFDDGTEVSGESVVLADLPKGALRFVRVSATNAGGESLPSEVVGARLAVSGVAKLLVVGGVDRFDGAQNVRDAAPLVGALDRMWIERMNHGAYAVRHATALAAGGYAFDGATDDAIENRDIDLAQYRAIDWFVGEDTTAQDPISAASRAEVERFFLGGGSLLVSGSQLISALQDQGELQQFADAQLHASVAGEDAASYEVSPADAMFADVGPFSFLDDGPLGYDVDGADVLAAAGDATTVLAYATGGAAGIAWRDGADGSRGIVVGFPIEMIADDNDRRELLAAAMAAFGIDPEPEDVSASGCGCASSAGGGHLTALLALGFVGLLVRRRRTR